MASHANEHEKRIDHAGAGVPLLSPLARGTLAQILLRGMCKFWAALNPMCEGWDAEICAKGPEMHSQGSLTSWGPKGPGYG